LTITPQRLEQLDFSESYLPVRVMLVERAGQAAESLESLAGSRVATNEGSV
jgi:ABC-type amino acid transport substrate-binding protein